MLPLYTSRQSKKLDEIIIGTGLISGAELMSRAAHACFDEIVKRWSEAREITIFAGPGNNGGDGYLLGALLLLEDRYDVKLVACAAGRTLSRDASAAREQFLAGGGSEFPAGTLLRGDLLVDAMFGTGLKRPLDADTLSIVGHINDAQCTVLAVDVPSGLNSDTGAMMPQAVRADATVTFIVRKQGLYTAQGRDCCGEIVFASLGEWQEVLAEEPAAAQLLSYRDVCGHLSPCRRDVHKGDLGHVLVIGGNHGTAGAARLCAEAALRSGAGLVSVATRPEHVATIAADCPPLMVHAVSGAKEALPLTARADIVAVGPGLGQDDWAMEMMSVALDAKQWRVVDADALNLLAIEPCRSQRWVLTPHPGEAGRMLGISSAEVQKDRFLALAQLRERYGGVCVLKGSGTLLAAHDMPCPTVVLPGNPGMATAGAGDVLTGVVAGLLAQGLKPEVAAQTAVCVHAQAGDDAAQSGERGLLATDILAALRRRVNPGMDANDEKAVC